MGESGDQGPQGPGSRDRGSGVWVRDVGTVSDVPRCQ